MGKFAETLNLGKRVLLPPPPRMTINSQYFCHVRENNSTQVVPQVDA